MKICAIVAARNNRSYLEVLLPILSQQNIDVVIVDHESDDGSDLIYRKYMGRPIIEVTRLPWRGYFSLLEQLLAKKKISSRLPHDWIIHHDVDEILEGRRGESLRSLIEGADRHGYNAINFDEFVFLPEENQSYEGANYVQEMSRYYFFEPHGNRLNRAFRRLENLENISSAGHRLKGDHLKIDPLNHNLRHYIVMSEEHARRKYLNRHYDLEDLRKGWHGNRLDFTLDNLKMPANSVFLRMITPNSNMHHLDRSQPAKLHYWAWQTALI